jgi:hypothetical protein
VTGVLGFLRLRFTWWPAAKPLFLGLIVGEAAAAGFWLLMGIAMSELGVPYEAIRIMPY